MCGFQKLGLYDGVEAFMDEDLEVDAFMVEVFRVKAFMVGNQASFLSISALKLSWRD